MLKNQKKYFLIILPLFLTGCVTPDNATSQVLSSGTWGIFIASVFVTRCFARDYIFNKPSTYSIFTVFMLMSIVGIFKYSGEGALVTTAFIDSASGMTWFLLLCVIIFFGFIVIFFSGLLVGIIFLPMVALYTIGPLYILRELDFEFYETIASLITFIYAISFIFNLPTINIWLWLYALFT
ncbi:MAG: hypothetical protein HY807_05035 [Nitrospirae bacterium]|nr:hypothetical protein [Nitrospirota bacterium]